MKLFWTCLPLRTAWLVVLQYMLAVLASAHDGFLSFVGLGFIILPSTALLVGAGYTAIKRGYWITAFFALIGILLGLVVVAFLLVLLSVLGSANR